MAARINKKRSFLFVSKVLGKHIPVNPYTPLLTGAALGLLLYREQLRASPEGDCCTAGTAEAITEEAVAGARPQETCAKGRAAGAESDEAAARSEEAGSTAAEQAELLLDRAVRGLMHPAYAEEAYRDLVAAKLVLPRPALFIGFAETATALGHSMYRLFDGGAAYIHTTREDIPDLQSVISFEEEHSHAVDHLCYALEPSLLSGGEPVILVDDEITTGNTVINIIRDIQSKFPRKEYVVASILDWRTGRNLQTYGELEKELDIRITSLCLLQGSIEVSGAPLFEAADAPTSSASTTRAPVVASYIVDGMKRLPVCSIDSLREINAAPYIRGSGRFGIRPQDNTELDRAAANIARKLRTMRGGGASLVLGVGEFMYLPMRVAAEMGEDVFYQSTTRSPIHPGSAPDYGVLSAEAYPSAGDPGITNYIYNVAPGQYDDIFVLLEREVPASRIQPMLDVLNRLAGRRVHLIVLSGEREREAEE
ncbi:phosphoribosyltransferase family protein [Paenibacillus rhizophilus]|uniref:phosphoribosyltransferase family protein n=1 Tax=Paenibacillus rhizophilus TaxID=1850366 RepID=UPI00363E1AEC